MCPLGRFLSGAFWKGTRRENNFCADRRKKHRRKGLMAVGNQWVLEMAREQGP